MESKSLEQPYYNIISGKPYTQSREGYYMQIWSSVEIYSAGNVLLNLQKYLSSIRTVYLAQHTLAEVKSRVPAGERKAENSTFARL